MSRSQPPTTTTTTARSQGQERVQTHERTRTDLAADLDSLLADMTGAHESWLAAVHAHRDAVRRADTNAMQAALTAQQNCATRVVELEEKRRAVVERAARLPEFSPSPMRPRQGPLTLGEIAAITPAPVRDRLVERATHLRSLIGDLRRANSTLQAASAALLAHTEGLMRQVARRLSTAGTYGRRGFVEPAASLACAVDLVQ